MDSQSEDDLTIEEVSEFIVGLSDADLAKLNGAARVMSVKCWREPEELLNEAIYRAIDGRRACPRRMKPLAFLFGVMRSIADEWVNDRQRSRGPSDATQWGSPSPVDIETLADCGPTPADNLEAAERRAAAAEVLAEVDKMFKDDEEAWFIIQADMEGEMGPNEVCETLGIDRKRYDTARKRMRRGYDKIYARRVGEKP